MTPPRVVGLVVVDASFTKSKEDDDTARAKPGGAGYGSNAPPAVAWWLLLTTLLLLFVRFWIGGGRNDDGDDWDRAIVVVLGQPAGTGRTNMKDGCNRRRRVFGFLGS